MATQLAMVNNVLRRLREDSVSSVAETSYATLVAQWVNDAKTEMEDVNHEWSVYVTEIDTTILADSATRTYDLTSTTDRSWLIRNREDDRVPQAFDITANEVGQLFDCAYKELQRERALQNDTSKTVTIPRAFAVTSDSDGRGWTLELPYPVTTGETARSWRTYWYVPQADLALDGTDDATEVKLPQYPIEMLALYYAINERGEEMGQPGGIAFGRAQSALAAALETDMQVQKRSDEPTTDFNNGECL